MIANPTWHFEADARTSCKCEGTWTKHCHHRKCRWLVCLNCKSIYDMTGKRFVWTEEAG